jgi:hypothetical protein
MRGPAGRDAKRTKVSKPELKKQSSSFAMAIRARREMRTNQRYEWLGGQPRWRVRRIFEKSRISNLQTFLFKLLLEPNV